MCYPDESASINDLNLTQYDVVPLEPLNDLKEHINNMLKELPKYLTDEEIEAVLSTKEKRSRLPSFLYCSSPPTWKQLPLKYQKVII